MISPMRKYTLIMLIINDDGLMCNVLKISFISQVIYFVFLLDFINTSVTQYVLFLILTINYND